MADHLATKGAKLLRLSLEGNQLRSVPFLNNVAHLTHLNLASNLVAEVLPSEIGHLKSLVPPPAPHPLSLDSSCPLHGIPCIPSDQFPLFCIVVPLGYL